VPGSISIVTSASSSNSKLCRIASRIAESVVGGARDGVPPPKYTERSLPLDDEEGVDEDEDGDGDGDDRLLLPRASISSRTAFR
jgi:hypothetical protein